MSELRDKNGMTEAQFLRSHRPLARRLTELEAENQKLRAQVAAFNSDGYVMIQRIDAKRLCGGDTNSPGWALSSRRVFNCLNDKAAK